jgi:hypothetical protein
MAVNRLRKYSRFLERKLHNSRRADRRKPSSDSRGFGSGVPRIGRWHRSSSFLPRIHMDPILSRTPPLNILIIPADAPPDVAPSLSALKSHWTLVCPVEADVVETARRFEPDIVLVDEQVAGLLRFPFQLAGAAIGRSPVFVVMSRWVDGTHALPRGYSHILRLPATAVELEQLLWQIRKTAIGQTTQRTGRPDTGMIG